MSKTKRISIKVQGTAIAIVSQDSQDFISLTDMAKKFGDDVLIYSWMRNRNTLEFIGIWEKIHNPDFKGLEFETFKNQAGLNSFSLTPRKWIEATGAIGFQSRAGRYGGGTYAHKDIAFEFGSWLSPEFKLYLIKEFQRLKDEENDRLKLDWNLQRTLAKINYRMVGRGMEMENEPLFPAPAGFLLQVDCGYARSAHGSAVLCRSRFVAYGNPVRIATPRR